MHSVIEKDIRQAQNLDGKPTGTSVLPWSPKSFQRAKLS